MKNIENFVSDKYNDLNYVKVKDYIYKTSYIKNQDTACISFVQAKESDTEQVKDLDGWKYNEEYYMYELFYNGKMYFRSIDFESENMSETIMVFDEEKEQIFVTSLSFIQEPKLLEGKNSSDISQYPLEDILDEYSCWISDFYEDFNSAATDKCCLEFAAYDIEDIKELRKIIGKHVFNKDDKLIIE